MVTAFRDKGNEKSNTVGDILVAAKYYLRTSKIKNSY